MSTNLIRRAEAGTTESVWVRYTLTGITLIFLFLFLVLPLAAVFAEALRKGFDAYWEALKEPDAWSDIRLTLITALIAVPLNLVFGIAAAWCIAKYEFKGKSVLHQAAAMPKTKLSGTAIKAVMSVRRMADQASGSLRASQ